MDINTTSSPKITKETKNKIHIEFADRTSLKERWMMRLKNTSFWMEKLWVFARFLLMVGISYVILSPFLSKILHSFMAKEDFIDATVNVIPKHWYADIYRYIIIDNHYFEAMLNTALLALLCAFHILFRDKYWGYNKAPLSQNTATDIQCNNYCKGHNKNGEEVMALYPLNFR